MHNVERILDQAGVGGFSPFSLWFPIQKGNVQANGDWATDDRWALEGPLTHGGRDIQGDHLRVVRKGLEYHTAIGGPVDWEHGYEKYLDADALMGEGSRTWMAPHPTDGSEVLHMRTELFDPGLKPVVMKAVTHLRAGGKLGYSVAGGGIRENDTGRIVPVVTTVACTIKPVQFRNSGCLQLVKAIEALELSGDDLRPGSLPTVPETWNGIRQMFVPICKALECEGSLPHSGPGIGAAAVEDLRGSGGKRRKRKRTPEELEEFGEELEKALGALVGYELADCLALA